MVRVVRILLAMVMVRRARERAIDLLFLVPTLVILAVFLGYPLVYGVVLSVHDTQGFELTSFVGLDHYARAIFGDAVFHRSLLNTLLFTGVAVVLQTGLGLLLAVLVADVRRGRTSSVRVLRALRPGPGGRRHGLEVPVRAVLRDRGRRLGRPRDRRPDDRAARRPRHGAVGDHGRLPVAVHRLQHGRLPGGHPGAPARVWRVRRREGAGRFQQFRRVTWPLLWPQTFVLVLLTTIGTLRIFDMVWVMTEGGPSHATETVATDVYVTAFRFLEVGYAQAMAMILLVLILLLTLVEYRILNRRAEAVSREPAPTPRRTTVVLSVLAFVWLYPVIWTLTNAVKSSADIYRAPWDIPWPPAIGNIGEAWSRGQTRAGDGELGLRHRADRGGRPRAVGQRRVCAHAAPTARPGPAVPGRPGAADHPDGGPDRPAVLDVSGAGPDQQPARARH